MAENLDYAVSGSRCYNNNDANCITYGRLYDWVAAMTLASSCNINNCSSQVQSNHKGVCPVGWHLPSDAEWDILITTVGGSSTAGTKLKATSGWGTNGNGTDYYGFAALPGGSSGPAGDYGAGYQGFWLSTTERDGGSIYRRYITSSSEGVNRRDEGKSRSSSVRCVMD
jgi:uncharacterized protein (TIGR02145 family)